MTTATSAVAIGRIPSTTPPCEASTVCTANAISNGNRMLTHSIAIASCGHSRRGGSGRRKTISSASEHNPAIAVRNAVSAIGSMADTAMRVAGSVPPKMAMPIKPSNRPRCWRDNEGEGMMREVANLPAGVQRWLAPHGGHALLSSSRVRMSDAPRNDDYRRPRLLQTRPTPDTNNRPSTTSRKFPSLNA